MLTIERLAQLDNKERQALLVKMATAFTGKAAFQSELARQIGRQTSTVYSWTSGKAQVPAEVLLLLDAWMGGPPPPSPDLEIVAAQLADACKAMQLAASTFERVARRRLLEPKPE